MKFYLILKIKYEQLLHILYIYYDNCDTAMIMWNKKNKKVVSKRSYLTRRVQNLKKKKMLFYLHCKLFLTKKRIG